MLTTLGYMLLGLVKSLSSILPTPGLDHSTSLGVKCIYSSPPVVLLPSGKLPCGSGALCVMIDELEQFTVENPVVYHSGVVVPCTIKGGAQLPWSNKLSLLSQYILILIFCHFGWLLEWEPSLLLAF